MKKTLKLILRVILILIPTVGLFYLVFFLLFMEGFGKGFSGDSNVEKHYGDTTYQQREVEDTILNEL